MTDSIILDKKFISGKKRKKIVILFTTLLLLIIVSSIVLHFSWNYWTVRALLENDDVVEILDNFKYGKYNGYGYTYLEKYYPGEYNFRFFIYDGIDYFTISYFGTDAYYSVYTELDYCYLIDSSCLNKDVLKSFIDKKSDLILSEIKEGISSPEFMFKVKLNAEYRSDYFTGNDPPNFKEFKASSFMKYLYARIDDTGPSAYYDYYNYNNGSRYIAASGDIRLKPQKVVGTISSVEEFNAMLEDADFELTYYDLFGEIDTIN